MDLGQWAGGSRARVVDVSLPDPDRLRLAELGLAEGTVLSVVQRAAFGGRVVALGASRLALDAGTCTRIRVEPAALRAS